MNADLLKPLRLPLIAIAMLAPVSALDVVVEPAADNVIFDEGLFIDGQVEIVNGKIVLKEGAPKAEEKKQEPDPAGDQVLELTDGSLINGSLVSLGRNEI